MNDAQKWLHKVPGLLTFFLVIALGITLANLLWLVLTPAAATAEAAVLASAPRAISSPKQNYGKLIADEHMFGAVPKQAPKAAPVRRDLPKTVAPPVAKNLNLKLHGIVASNKDGNGFAMISFNGKTQETYKRGEELPKKEMDKERELSGVILKRVDNNSVVIDNNGTEQLLELAEASLTSSSSAAKAAPTRATTARKARPTRAATNRLGSNDPNQLQTLAELRDALLEDSQIITTVITPSLVRENGQVTGLRVYPSQNRALFRELGFRNGDIIKQVNDVVIDGSPSNLSVLQQFADSPSLEITILRGGNEQILTPTF
ncbi:type II secretion system protein N [Leucothrix arctica]|uniref:Type II secretion system protein GspC N-terminal domain-containing protein n=1 Tax=Leucothrix arctica TaxID=1481894 RepID=A0A317C8Y1_9GAMM|nr:type II secretion system protein N [Leucothrix arctica]PWQ94767.1 hypothetical protein DKT75_15910 [Leucothrix arctica]